LGLLFEVLLQTGNAPRGGHLSKTRVTDLAQAIATFSQESSQDGIVLIGNGTEANLFTWPLLEETDLGQGEPYHRVMYDSEEQLLEHLPIDDAVNEVEMILPLS